ncbi:hypothetical protein K491DRAFT_692178 [Lophiostoma macrostomum CBS 122681]|uniref:Uncharacterized protein n=1 Tax=Lophiostoma macrostomum CBS 122681 TaxID=1314788 RepID=A0A6A6T901_9PLEO|nr:hypothetical protein K491DRAFT_692178 [Lophiostoma macrostomum CBS 122681]
MPHYFHFLKLPAEIRDHIYSFYFKPVDRLVPNGLECDCEDSKGGGFYKFDFAIYSVNKQIKTEAEDVFRRENVFVKIETPWPQAEHHISHEGLVPLVCKTPAAEGFKHAQMTLQISAPLHSFLPQHTLVVLLDDLPLFCDVWFYSSLNYRTLNEHLKVEFTLHDPYYPADPKPIPLKLQRKLLGPFDAVKGLYEVQVNGFEEEVERELRVGMAVPYITPGQSLEASASLMEAGDQAIANGRAQEALDLFIKSFHAIHIVIKGRTRRVLADSFFDDEIEEGRFKGQAGMTMRIILRINLVSRTVGAYLKLAQWAEAAFWGIRSINMLRRGIDTEFESFLGELVAVSDIGLLYLRTGIAVSKMEDSGDAELEKWRDEPFDTDMTRSVNLFGASRKYLKGKDRALIQKELDEYGVGEGVFENDEGSASASASRSDVDSLAPMDRAVADAVEGLQLDEDGLPEAEGSVWS